MRRLAALVWLLPWTVLDLPSTAAAASRPVLLAGAMSAAAPSSAAAQVPATFWTRYRMPIVASTCLAATIWIVGLAATRRRRRATKVPEQNEAGFGGSSSDASARQQAEDELLQKQAQLLAAMQIARMAYWDYDVRKDEFTFNDQFYALLRTSADLEGGYTMSSERFARRFVHPEDADAVKAEIQKAIAATDPDYRQELDHRVVCADGTTGFFALHIRLSKDSQGRTVRAYGANLDITERKRVEAELTSSIREVIDLKVALDECAIVATTDPTGRITYANDKFCQISKHSRDELIGQNHRLLKSGHHPEEFYRNLWRTITEGRVWSGEINNRASDGRFFWIMMTIVPFLDDDGKPREYVAISHDITERKQAEETAQALSRRLISAQEEERARLARELHDDVTQRLARVAIDAGRVERQTRDAATAETMRTVREELVRLSEDVHALSYRLHPSLLEDLGLPDALNAECDRCSRQTSVPINLTLRELPEAIPRDAALCLFRVAQGALRNVALHARAKTVEVSLRGLDGGLQLAVRDDGVGFDPELPRKAPGLGLASMRERAHLLGGEFETESAPGHGTTILVWVPLKG